MDTNNSAVITSPPEADRSIAMSVSVCGSVCLSAHISQIPHNHKCVQTSQNFVYMLPVAVAQSSPDGNAICSVTGFVNDVMFSHNGANTDTGLESSSSP